MNKFFTFADRYVPVQFFEDQPVKLTLTISNDTDRRILDCGRAFAEADKKQDMEQKAQRYREILGGFIGAEHVDAILDRADVQDAFAVFEVYNYICTAYQEAKRKKLMGSVR